MTHDSVLMTGFTGRVEVVQDPVRRPGDNLFLTLDTEDILTGWDAVRTATLSPASSPQSGERGRAGVTRKAVVSRESRVDGGAVVSPKSLVVSNSPLMTQDSRLVMGQTAFMINGRSVLALRKPEAGGRFSLVVREGLMNALLDAAKNGKPEALREFVKKVGGRQSQVASRSHLNVTYNDDRLTTAISAIHESVALTSRVASDLVVSHESLVGSKAHLSAPSVLNDSRLNTNDYSLLVTTEVFRKNYGIARSIGILASLGYRVFIEEDDSMTTDADRAEFFKAYHLEGFVESKVLVPVAGDEASMRQQIAQATRKRFEARDVMRIGFEGDGARRETWKDVSRLVLRNDLLGLGKKNRADYPVLLLAAKLLSTPEEIQKLGPEYIARLGANAWQMNATPDSLDLSQALVDEIMNYQAIAQRVASAA